MENKRDSVNHPCKFSSVLKGTPFVPNRGHIPLGTPLPLPLCRLDNEQKFGGMGTLERVAKRHSGWE